MIDFDTTKANNSHPEDCLEFGDGYSPWLLVSCCQHRGCGIGGVPLNSSFRGGHVASLTPAVVGAQTALAPTPVLATTDSSSSTYTSKKVNGPRQALALSKLLKEARQLGYGSINSTSDAMISKEWIKRMIVTIDDMSLGTEMRLRVATRLLEGRAQIWWESLKSRSFGQVTSLDFLREFDEEYYNWFHPDQKRHEFMRLVQGTRQLQNMKQS